MNTPFLDRVYNQVEFDRELVFKFFSVFSLFEYALKQTEYKYARQNDDVQADWDAFARYIQFIFIPTSSPELAEAVSYFFEHPPMKQVLENEHVYFRSCEPSQNSTTENLAIYIRRVRNNLFHGAKFRYNPGRDTELIKNSLIILESWSRLLPEVQVQLENAR